jgi:undecaprenyl-diphosphatase
MHLIFFLSLVQGVTEFVPISSSSHLIILSRYFDLENNGILIDVSLHIGSFIAVVTFFYKDVINFFQDKRLFLKIAIASLPVIIVGFF